METVYKYKPVLKNEVPVFLEPMQKLFEEKTVFVLGYGSLAHSNGWLGRGLLQPPKRDELIECKARGFERGPYGLFGLTHFYGVIRHSEKKMNGALGRIKSLDDWVYLMRTECIAGLTSAVNYRVVDITENIYDDKGELPSNAVVHMVVNRPSNRQDIQHAWPSHEYYSYCWNGIKLERTPEFASVFLQTGGFRNDRWAQKFIDALIKKAGRAR